MIAPLLLLLPLLAAPTPVQEPGPTPPDPELVETTAKALRRALSRGDAAAKVEAVQRASAVVAPDVIEQLARGFREDEAEVRLAVIRALGSMEHPDALTALADAYRQRRELHEDPALYEALVKGLARHGSPDSIGLLIDFSTRHLTRPVMRARVLGLGRVRDRAAVAALFALMDKLGPRESRPYLDDLRTALVALVGPQPGVESPDEWRRWWREHGDVLVVPAAAPELTGHVGQAWRRYWELAGSNAAGR